MKPIVKNTNRVTRSNASASTRFMKELENRILYISDTDVSLEEIPLLCRFLGCKQAHSEIKAIYLVRSEANVELKKTRKGGKVVDTAIKHSALNCENARLFRALIDCISKCESLETITLTSVEIPPEILEQFGRAIFKCKAGETYI